MVSPSMHKKTQISEKSLARRLRDNRHALTPILTTKTVVDQVRRPTGQVMP